MHWDDLEQYNTDEVIEDISDGELFELESATRIAYRDYSKHIAAVEAYEQALAKRRRYEEYCAAKKVANSDNNSPRKGRTNSHTNQSDPFLVALQVDDNEGYDADGFDSQGYDREGYNRAGFNRYTGYNRGGYDIHGNSRGSDLTSFPKL